MSTRRVTDCDKCDRRDLEEFVELKVIVGQSVDVADARMRDDYTTIHLCTECSETIIGRVLILEGEGGIQALDCLTRELVPVANRAATKSLA